MSWFVIRAEGIEKNGKRTRPCMLARRKSGFEWGGGDRHMKLGDQIRCR